MDYGSAWSVKNSSLLKTEQPASFAEEGGYVQFEELRESEGTSGTTLTGRSWLKTIGAGIMVPQNPLLRVISSPSPARSRRSASFC